MSAAGLRTVTHTHTQTYLRRENFTFVELHIVAPKQPGLKSNRWRCLGCPSTDGLSRSGFTTINQLKQAIVTEWGKLLEHLIDRAIGQWRRRLEWVVPQQGKQIEHLM